MSSWQCYVLEEVDGNGRTYVGCTRDVARRIREHNDHDSRTRKGAKATRGRSWRLIAVMYGFPDRSSAMQMESHIKHSYRKRNRAIELARIRQLCKDCGKGCRHRFDWSKLETFLFI